MQIIKVRKGPELRYMVRNYFPNEVNSFYLRELAEISEEDKNNINILYENAVKIFKDKL